MKDHELSKACVCVLRAESSLALGNRGSLKKSVSFDTATPWRVQKTVQCDSKSKFQGQLLNPPPRRSLARRACVSLPKRHMDETTTRCCGYEGEGDANVPGKEKVSERASGMQLGKNHYPKRGEESRGRKREAELREGTI